MLVVGLDWGRLAHEFEVVDECNARVSLYSGTVENSTLAFDEWGNKIESVLPGHGIRLAVESGNGLSYPVEVFAKSRGWEVVALPVNSVKAYREHVMRKNNKTDRIDALAIARLASEVVSEKPRSQPRKGLRRATRDRDKLAKEKTRLVNRLRQHLAEFWPEFTTDLVPDLATPALLHLLVHHPDPKIWAELGVAGLSELMKGAKIRTRSEYLAKLADAAKSYREIVTGRDGDVLRAEIRMVALRLEHCREDLKTAEAFVEQLCEGDSDVAVLDDLTGAGEVLAPAIMAEIQDIDNFPSGNHLASFAGLGRKRHQTGKSADYQVEQRRYNRRLKNYMLQFAMCNAQLSSTSQQYLAKKLQTKKPIQARRALARQLVNVIYRTLKRRKATAGPNPQPS